MKREYEIIISNFIKNSYNLNQLYGDIDLIKKDMPGQTTDRRLKYLNNILGEYNKVYETFNKVTDDEIVEFFHQGVENPFIFENDNPLSTSPHIIYSDEVENKLLHFLNVRNQILKLIEFENGIHNTNGDEDNCRSRTKFHEVLKLNGINPFDIINHLTNAGIIQAPESIDNVLQCKNKITIIVEDPHEWAWSIVKTLIDYHYSNLRLSNVSTPISAVFNFLSGNSIRDFKPKKFNEDRDEEKDYSKQVKKILNFS